MLMNHSRELAERQRILAENHERLAGRKRELEERKQKLAEYQNELAELEQAYQRGNFQLFVVCGQEESVSTMLIKEFCGWKRRIFFRASGKDSTTLLNFTETLARHYEKMITKTFAGWDIAFKYIADNEQSKNRMTQRLVLVLHEFPDPVKRDEQFMSMFKNAIEQHLSRTKIFVILSCSDAEFVQKYFLDDNALLHDDMSGCIKVENLNENISLDDASAEELTEEAVRTAKGISNARSKIEKFSADDVILREGETNDTIYKIIKGSAVCWFKYETDNEYLLASLSDGECFGEYSVLTREPGIYTAVAFTDMLVMKITKDDLVSFIEANAKNAVEIMSNMARMMNVLTMNIDMILNE